MGDLKKFGKYLTEKIKLIRPLKRGYLTSNSLIFEGDQMMIVDAGFQHGTGYLAELRKEYIPEYLFFSHYHIDHLIGCHEFQESTKIIHDPATNNLLAARTRPRCSRARETSIQASNTMRKMLKPTF